jgi:predicted RNase H-like nuclease (RuvC/YqgF family)
MSIIDEQELDLQLGEAREQIKQLRQELAERKRRLAHLEASIEAIRALCVLGLQPENEEETKEAEKFVWSR